MIDRNAQLTIRRDVRRQLVLVSNQSENFYEIINMRIIISKRTRGKFKKISTGITGIEE